jgi:hypothetical protein
MLLGCPEDASIVDAAMRIPEHGGVEITPVYFALQHREGRLGGGELGDCLGSL